MNLGVETRLDEATRFEKRQRPHEIGAASRHTTHDTAAPRATDRVCRADVAGVDPGVDSKTTTAPPARMISPRSPVTPGG